MRPEARESILGAAGAFPILSCHHARQWRLGRVRARATGATRGEGSRWQDEPESRNPIGGGFTLRADGDQGSRAKAIGRRSGTPPARVSESGRNPGGCSRMRTLLILSPKNWRIKWWKRKSGTAEKPLYFSQLREPFPGKRQSTNPTAGS